MSDDFEVHPIGTTSRLASLADDNKRLTWLLRYASITIRHGDRASLATSAPAQAVDPTMTRDELVAAAESIGMRFPAPTQAAPLTQEQIADVVREHLTSAYVCTRVWAAWSVGTMAEDDFEPASETDMADDIAAALIANGITGEQHG